MSYPNPYDMYGGDQQQQQQQQQQTSPTGSHGFTQWESLHSPLDTTTPPIPTPPTPFHHIDNAPILLHHPHVNPPHQLRHNPSPIAPGPMHPIDARIFRSLPGSSSSTPAPSASSSSVIRRTSGPSQARAAAHPYRHEQPTQASSSSFMVSTPSQPQPQSATGQRQVTTRSRSKKQQQQSVKFSATTSHGGMVERPTTRSQAQGSVTASSTATVAPEFFGRPTIDLPRQQQPISPQASTPGVFQPVAHIDTPPAQAQPRISIHPPPPPPPPLPHPRRTHLPHSIPSDMHYSIQTHTLSCSLSVPGVHPDHLRITLGTCFFNHVKYVQVCAESLPPFGSVEWGEAVRGAVRGEVEEGVRSGAGAGEEARPGGEAQPPRLSVNKITNPNLRERKFGIMRRLIQVPSHTTAQDISASLKHGVLSLDIYCGAPFEQDDEVEVPVRIE